MWKIATFLVFLWAALCSGTVLAGQAQHPADNLTPPPDCLISSQDFSVDNPASHANSSLFEAPLNGVYYLYVPRRNAKVSDVPALALALLENLHLCPAPRRLPRPYQEGCAISGEVHRAAQPVRAGPLS